MYYFVFNFGSNGSWFQRREVGIIFSYVALILFAIARLFFLYPLTRFWTLINRQRFFHQLGSERLTLIAFPSLNLLTCWGSTPNWLLYFWYLLTIRKLRSCKNLGLLQHRIPLVHVQSTDTPFSDSMPSISVSILYRSPISSEDVLFLFFHLEFHSFFLFVMEFLFLASLRLET